MEGKRILRFFVIALLSLLGALLAIAQRFTGIGFTLMVLAIGILLWLVFRPEANHTKEDNENNVG